MTIRAAKNKDATAIADLISQLGYPGMSAKDALAKIKSHKKDGYAMHIAESEGKVSGFISVHWFDMAHLREKSGRITALCVDHQVRSKGIGKELLASAEDILFSKGCLKIELTSNFRRDRAHDFYLSSGYTEEPKRFVKKKPD